MRTLRIGTRGSALALWQARFVQRRLGELADVQTEIVVIKTAGDRIAQTSVGQIGLKGVFIKELEDALQDERVDLAVHSMKDVPTEIPDGLMICAIAERADVRDCLVSKDGTSFANLPRGARIGTSSLRRQAQLRGHRPEIQMSELRGNVDTRLRKVQTGEVDAIVLAKAGLDRLGLAERITEVFAAEFLLPAAGQGALGMECRADDSGVADALRALDHAPTRAAVLAERAVLARLEGGCQVPLGVWGRCTDGELRLDACLLSPDGAQSIRGGASGSVQNAAGVGNQLAEWMFSQGAGELLRLAGRDLHAQ
jgi:hydroxymethylbilane synthase